MYLLKQVKNQVTGVIFDKIAAVSSMWNTMIWIQQQKITMTKNMESC